MNPTPMLFKRDSTPTTTPITATATATTTATATAGTIKPAYAIVAIRLPGAGSNKACAGVILKSGHVVSTGDCLLSLKSDNTSNGTASIDGLYEVHIGSNIEQANITTLPLSASVNTIKGNEKDGSQLQQQQQQQQQQQLAISKTPLGNSKVYPYAVIGDINTWLYTEQNVDTSKLPQLKVGLFDNNSLSPFDRPATLHTWSKQTPHQLARIHAISRDETTKVNNNSNSASGNIRDSNKNESGPNGPSQYRVKSDCITEFDGNDVLFFAETEPAPAPIMLIGFATNGGHFKHCTAGDGNGYNGTFGRVMQYKDAIIQGISISESDLVSTQSFTQNEQGAHPAGDVSGSTTPTVQSGDSGSGSIPIWPIVISVVMGVLVAISLGLVYRLYRRRKEIDEARKQFIKV